MFSKSFLFFVNFVHSLFVPLEREKNINLIDCNMRTPLMDAAEARSMEAVRLLLKHGANAAARDNLNETALHKLVVGGEGDHRFDQAIAVELVAAGCPLLAVSNFGLDAAKLAAQSHVAYLMPTMESRKAVVPVLDRHLDYPFSTARHRSSQVLLRK